MGGIKIFNSSKLILLLFFFLFFTKLSSQINFKNYPMNDKDQVVYVYDPMCGWCYGFSNVISQLQENYHTKISFTVMSGGMMTGAREEPISVMRDYIKGAYKNVEKLTGVLFGDAYLNGILESKTYISSSVLPSIALTVFKSMAKEKDYIAFAKAIQYAFYFDGKSLNDKETYRKLAEKMGLDTKIFMSKLDELSYKNETLKEFETVSQLGISGFPTVFVIRNGKGYLLSNGYVNYETISQNLERILKL